MKKGLHFIYLIILLVYVTSLFFIDHLYILLSFIVFHVILAIILKVPYQKMLMNLYGICFLTIFTVAINLLFVSYIEAIFIGIRLLLACNITYIFSYLLTPMKLIDAIVVLIAPLRLLKVNINEISILITIAITFIPIIARETRMIKDAFKAKCFQFTFKNVMKNGHLLFIAIIRQTFSRVDDLEKTLKVKAYEM